VPRCSPQISYVVSTGCSRHYRHTKSARDKQVGKSLMGTGEVQKGTEQKKKTLNEKCNMEDNRVLFVARHWWMLWPFADLFSYASPQSDMRNTKRIADYRLFRIWPHNCV